MDSTKLLTEKLALSRDLAAIAPEVEHLRSQVASHQTLLSEKLSLQRQLSTVQVELETEKRATQRALAKEGGRKAQDAQMESQIEELHTELAQERKLRQKTERDLQQKTSELESKQASMESNASRELKNALQEAENAQNFLSSRLDAFRTKLRSTKEQLKEAQDELKDLRLQSKADVHPPTSRQDQSNSLDSRKRSIAQVDVSSIGTPDGMPHAKRSRQGSAVPGDKSTFSITPFLNRTASLAPDSPQSANAIDLSTRLTADIEDKSNAHTLSDLLDDSGEAGVALSWKTSGKPLPPQPANAKKKGVPPGRPRKVSKLEKVQEEGEDEPLMVKSIVHGLATSRAVEGIHEIHNTDDTTFLKKLRKLSSAGGLGKTLFDEVEGDEDGHVQRGPSALRKPLHPAARKGVQSRKGKMPVGGFGAISPLKKDKRIGKAIGA